MMIKRLIYSAAIVLAAMQMSAQETNSLKACLEKGLENNYSLRIIRNRHFCSMHKMRFWQNAIPRMHMNIFCNK